MANLRGPPKNGVLQGIIILEEGDGAGAIIRELSSKVLMQFPELSS